MHPEAMLLLRHVHSDSVMLVVITIMNRECHYFTFAYYIQS